MFATPRLATRCLAVAALAASLLLLPALPACAGPAVVVRTASPILLEFEALVTAWWEAIVSPAEPPAAKNGPEADPYGHKGNGNGDRSGGVPPGGN